MSTILQSASHRQPTGQTTSTTTTSTHQSTVTLIRWNSGYLRTVPGILKVLGIALSLIAFICVQCSIFSHFRRGSYFSFVSMMAFWTSGILLLLYLFQVVYKLQRVPWTQLEFYFCVVVCVMYLIGASLAAAVGTGAYIAAAFFGYLAMIVYGYDAFLKYCDLREAGLFQRTTTTTTTTASSQVTISTPPFTVSGDNGRHNP